MKSANTHLIALDTKPWIEATAEVRQTFTASVPNGDTLYDQIRAAKG